MSESNLGPLTADGPLVLGHRGAPLVATENSIDALAAAFAAGLDGIETDVQRTRDGVLVLHHDPYIPGGDFIAKLTFDELRTRIPTVARLDELFALLVDHPEAVANLEVKTDAPFEDERASELTAAIGRQPANVKKRLWLSSFDPLLLLRLAACEVEAPLALIVSFGPALQLVPSLPLAAIHPHKRLVSTQRIDEWRSAGLKVYAWTVNDRKNARELLDLGVDGLFGDEPETLLQARSRFLEAGGVEVRGAGSQR